MCLFSFRTSSVRTITLKWNKNWHSNFDQYICEQQAHGEAISVYCEWSEPIFVCVQMSWFLCVLCKRVCVLGQTVPVLTRISWNFKCRHSDSMNDCQTYMFISIQCAKSPSIVINIHCILFSSLLFDLTQSLILII